jgi:hypothetical protein
MTEDLLIPEYLPPPASIILTKNSRGGFALKTSFGVFIFDDVEVVEVATDHGYQKVVGSCSRVRLIR